MKTAILRNGITGDEGGWQFELNDLRDRLNTLVDKNDLTIRDTRTSRLVRGEEGHKEELIDGFPVICACRDLIGASYYALVHNKHRNMDEVSYVVRFSCPLSSLYIDGRDFLYPCFQFWDRQSPHAFEKQIEILVRLYGRRIAGYFQRAASRKDPDCREAVCDLATQDSEVALDHAANQWVIQGRHGTIFCSAFFVRAPIEHQQILDVQVAEHRDFRPSITLDDFYVGRFEESAQKKT